MYSRRLDILFYGFQYPHHGKRSGFSALAQEMKHHCRVVSFPHPHFAIRLVGKLRSPSLVRWVIRSWFVWNEKQVLRKCHRDGLIHYFFPEDSLRVGTYSIPGLKMAVTCHQPLSYMKELKASGVNPGFFQGLEKADLVILMSDTELEEYKEFLPHTEVCCIRHGIDTDFFTPAASPASGGPLKILTVGNWLRDYELWAKVVALLAKRRSDVEVSVIANPGVVKKASASGCPGVPVNCLSGLSDEELVRAYQGADILFLPLQDAWANNALLEAMATGTPVVCTDLPATREYLGSDGVYVANNPDNFADEISALLDDPQKRAAVGGALRERVCTEFAWPVIAEQHMAAYERVMEGCIL